MPVLVRKARGLGIVQGQPELQEILSEAKDGEGEGRGRKKEEEAGR